MVCAIIVVGLAAGLEPPSAYGQCAPGVFVLPEVTVSAHTEDALSTVSAGGQIGFRNSSGLFLFGEYLYAGKDFYYYDSDEREWVRAASWQHVPSGSSSRGFWLFY